MTYTQTATMVKAECGQCGLLFGMSESFYQARRRDHKDFYCPAGHLSYYPGESDLEKERRLRRAAESEAALADATAKETRRKLSATRGVVTRIKRRAAHGVCQFCHRTFKNVQAHMDQRHPQEKERK